MDSVFKAVTPSRSFDDIVTQIQEAILTGKVATGDRLATERELVGIFGVSRATVREALRCLEVLGWVEIRLGAQGGVFTVRPSEGQAGSALESILRFHEATPRDLEEFRSEFEPETASWAAQRAQPSDIAALRKIVAAVHAATSTDDTEWRVVSQLDLQFHLTVAEASRNRVRVAVMLAVQQSVRNASLSLATVMTDDVRRSIADELAAIADAITAGDRYMAAARMREHVVRFSKMEADLLEQIA